MIRQKDVAAVCAVSQATVSRALKDDPRIDPEIRARVKRAAAEMGYTASPALQTLSLHRWSPGNITRPNIAVILATREFQNAFMRSGIMRARAAELGYHASEFSLTDYRTPENLRRILRARNIQGLIFDTWTAGCGDPRHWAEFSCVSVGSRFAPCPFDSVIFDHYLALRTSLETIAGRGYRRLAPTLYRTPSRRDDDARTAAIEGARDRLAAEGVTVLPTLYLPDDYEEALRRVKRLVIVAKPDVVVGFNKSILDMLRHNGFSVPGRVGFFSIHNRDQNPRLASPVYDEKALSTAAVERLSLVMQSGRRGAPEFPCTILVAMHAFHGWDTLPVKTT